MQGSYNKGGLPRPYYMKPSKGKKLSPYDNLPKNYFNSPKRKLLGYVTLLLIFSMSIYSLGQAMRSSPDAFDLEEMENFDSLGSNHDSKSPINNVVDIKNNDGDSSNIGLAGNMAVGSKGDVGMGVKEAPKGGIANEAPMVGNDEDEIVKGKPSPKKAGVDAENLAEFEEDIDVHHIDD